MSFKIDTNRQRSVCFDKQSTSNRNADQTIALKSSSSNQTFSNALNASNFKAISKKSISNHDIFTLRKHQTKSISRTDNSRRNAESCVCRLCVGQFLENTARSNRCNRPGSKTKSIISAINRPGRNDKSSRERDLNLNLESSAFHASGCVVLR